MGWHRLRLIFFVVSIVIYVCQPERSFSQVDSEPNPSNSVDTISKDKKQTKFQKISEKIEKAFVYIPVPTYSYSLEAGHTFGLAKFNVFSLYEGDTVTMPSKLSEVFTFSSKGRINASVSTDLVFKDNKYIVLSFFNYKRTPEYILGIGNDVSIDSIEEITSDRLKFDALVLRKTKIQNLYTGLGLDVTNYFSLKTDSNSYLVRHNVSGLNGGFELGLKVLVVLEGRKNRYNPQGGHYIGTALTYYPAFLGSDYDYVNWEFDARKYFNPWLNHIVAFQVATKWTNGDVPFYSLALMGGENRMRGYYKGAIRDKVLIDSQIEYRAPIWKIFGLVGWFGFGRVAPTYSDFDLDGVWFSYGAGLRIMVSSEFETNIRFDLGFGPGKVHGFVINFAEAF